jgi:DNA-binding XRE family transcriptional regulator
LANTGIHVSGRHRIRRDTVALPFCDLVLRAPIRSYPYRWKCTQAVPKEPRTIGDNLKRRRLQLHLFQSHLAKLFGVDIASIRNWEHNRYPPAQRYKMRVIDWLGYDPGV